MNAKEYLNQCRLLNQRINFNLRQMREIRDGIEGIRPPRLGGDRVQTSPDRDPFFVKALARLSELEETIDRETDLLADLRKQIGEAVSTLRNPNHQMVLLYRYVAGLKWPDISGELGVGLTTLKRWHAAALELMWMPQDPIDISRRPEEA